MKKKLQMIYMLVIFVLCLAGCDNVISGTDTSDEMEQSSEVVYVKAPLDNEECVQSSYTDIEEAFLDAGFEIVWPVSYQVEYEHPEYEDGDIVKVEIQEEEVEKDKEYDAASIVFVYVAIQPFAREVAFGNYFQNDTENKEPISWYVVTTQGDKCLLVSKNILDFQPFNDTTISQATSWEDSSLRNWLNDTFFYAAFSSQEQKNILTTTVQDYEADGKLGGKTEDKVFLLSYDEAWEYFPTDDDRKAELTIYGQTQSKITNNSWWLINSYSSGLYKYVVDEEGGHENSPRVNESEGIRPAIWVKKDIIDE